MQEREKFGSRLGFILVSAGCAIGLGNVWKFPYICGQNGGAAFIVIYLICLVALGLPILICEYAIGRGSRRSLATAFKLLEPKGSKYHHNKWFSIAGNYLLMMFYTMVGGWMLYYSWRMLSGNLAGLDPAGIADGFTGMLGSPVTMTVWMIIAVALSFGVCALGLQNGVEKITKVLMILLIILMVVLAVNSLLLNNASAGIRFYMVPDFKKMVENGVGNVVFAAMSHAFFTLSIGIGSMEIFGSYLGKERTLLGEASSVLVLDTLVALVAGFIIIPACFAFGVEPDAGPPLLFITLPNVFNQMAGGRIWGTCFFIFMSFAALSTIIAVFENIISMTMEAFNWTRKQSVARNLVLIIVLSMPAILGFNLISGFQPMGPGSTFMDLEDFIVSYNILPLGSLMFVLFCTKKNGWGFDNFVKEVNEGQGPKIPGGNGLKFYMMFIVPIIIIVIFLKGYYDMFKSYPLPQLIGWMCLAVALLVGILVLSFTKGKEKE